MLVIMFARKSSMVPTESRGFPAWARYVAPGLGAADFIGQ